MIQGEPGVGKSALVEYARGTASGMRVLVLRAARAEAELAFAGLHALLSPVLPLLDRLPEVQARALGGLLGLRAQDDPQLLPAFAGVLGLLAESAEEVPLLVAVDDAHWLDQGSAAAISFVARRLQAEQVAVVIAQREGESQLDSEGLAVLRLGGLGPEAARALLEAELGSPVSPVVSRVLAERCAGNPLVLLEVGRKLSPEQLSARAPLPGPVPVPPDLAETFLPAVRVLPPGTQRLLLLGAVGEGLPEAVVSAAAAELGEVSEEALLPAEQAGLVTLEGGRVKFRHPLVALSVHSVATSLERRRVHRALAGALSSAEDEDRRAWHLAAAAPGPSEEVASLLEAAGERARRRGGFGSQAAALVRAAELSEEHSQRARRLHAACRASYWAGDKPRALQLGQEALALAKDPLVRVDVVHQLAVIAQFDVALRSSAPSTASLEKAAAEVEPQDAARAVALLGVVLQRLEQAVRVEEAHEVACRRLALAQGLGGERLFRARQDLAVTLCLRGDAAQANELLDELAAERARHERLPQYASQVAEVLLWTERYDELRALLVASLSQARADGNLLRVCFDLTNLALLELRLGQLDSATGTASEALVLSRAMSSDYLEACDLAVLAGIAARRGPPEACREHAGAAAKLALALGDNSVLAQSHGARGLMALGSGSLETALIELERATEAGERPGLVEPGVQMLAHELVEARTRLGQLGAAASALERFEHVAEATGRRWALAATARCRALLADDAAFEPPFEEALARSDAEPLLFERARTRLYYGERLRRAGQRRSARRQLRDALDQLDTIGAHLWADRARAELRATGETVAQRDASAMERLTAQELQIARLVAAGKTNREVSEAMFLSPKTIDYHLAHVFRKLAIHSRRELMLLFANWPGEV